MIWLILLGNEKTIRLLNDDGSLELFKKTLPCPSLVQMMTRGAIVRQKTVMILKDPRVDFVMLAPTGKASSFDKGLKIIDDMVDSAWQWENHQTSNHDDTLELFKKNLPSPSLIQGRPAERLSGRRP